MGEGKDNKSGFNFGTAPLDAKLAASLLETGKFSLAATATHKPVSFGLGVADHAVEIPAASTKGPTVLISTNNDPVGDKAPQVAAKPAEPTVVLSDGPLPPKPQPKLHTR